MKQRISFFSIGILSNKSKSIAIVSLYVLTGLSAYSSVYFCKRGSRGMVPKLNQTYIKLSSYRRIQIIAKIYYSMALFEFD